MDERMRQHGAPAVFLDLNGTLVEPVRPTKLDDFTLLPGAVTAIKTLNSAGFICPVITVQTRIAKGLFSEADFRAWFTTFQDTLTRQDARVVGPYLCPHNTTAGCACAKPQVTLYRQAIRDYAIDSRRSYAVGDTDADIGAAASLGVPGCLVLTGWGRGQVERIGNKATYVGTDVFTVAQWIVAESERRMPAQ